MSLLRGLAVLLVLPSLAVAQATSLSGRVHVIWDTERLGRGAAYYVVPTDGQPAVRVTPSSAAQAERLQDLDRQTVRASVVLAATHSGGELRGQLMSLQPLEAAGPAGLRAEPYQDRTFNFVTVLCRFADDPSTPFTPEQVAIPHGNTFPGLRYHYLEMSQFPSTMTGSAIFGWYNLPKPRSDYVVGGNTSFSAVAQDCAKAAEADVNYADFYGINLQLNGALSTRPTPPYDTLSFGGSHTLTLDGQTRSYGVTWMSGRHWNNYVVLHHEVGHALGWPHSSGDYGQEYDSRWDLMSAGYITLEAPWGWRGPHTIMPHRIAAGWVAPERIWQPDFGVTNGRLARAALSPDSGYQALVIPIDGTRRYVAEARMPAGLDVGLPGSAVIIHEVRGNVRSYIVDPDRNSNPNDEAAMWKAGETFADTIVGFALTVNSLDAAGANVTVRRGWNLNVALTGTGEVTVTPTGQSASVCSAACSRLIVTQGLAVQLTATPGAGRAFAGWSGACTGTGTCNVTMNGTRSVTAIFASAPIVNTTSLVNGMMGATYSRALSASAEAGVTGWAVRGGALPPGLSLNTGTGALTGVPEASGTFTFTVAALSYGLETQQELTLVVEEPVLALDAVIDDLVGLASMTEDQRRYLDLSGNRNGRVDVGDVRRWLLTAGHLSAAQRAAALRALPPAPRDR